MLNYDHQKEIKDTLERMGTRTRAGEEDVDEVVRVEGGGCVRIRGHYRPTRR